MAASSGFAPDAEDLALLEAVAKEAGDIALRFYRGDNRVWNKAGDSPVSEADLAVDRFLREALAEARPDYGWLSEETEDDESRLERDRAFIVDPIDGTRAFVRGEPGWCISVAAVVAGRPSAAVLHCPALERMFAARRGHGARLNGTAIAPAIGAGQRRITGSRRINEAVARRFPGAFTIVPVIPSLAYRIALVACGEVDGALARSGAHEWDVAAADLIVSEAGGRLTDREGKDLVYNRPTRRLHALVASGAEWHGELMDIANSGDILH